MPPLERLYRRTHLYLGLFLLPWMLVYGTSSLLLSHPDWFRGTPEPPWRLVGEIPFEHPSPAPPDGTPLRAVGERILESLGNNGAFWIERVGTNQLRITRFSFLDQTRYTCLLAEGTLRTEHRHRGWTQVLMNLHFRGGFQQPTVLDTVWAVLVDIVCAAMVLWVVTGLIMACQRTQVRIWSVFFLACGSLCFTYFIARL